MVAVAAGLVEAETHSRVVLFVCPHGAGKSRMAAAFFNARAPSGWSATTAGLEAQEAVSVHAPRLLAGTAAEPHLDQALPRPISALAAPPLRTIAIDCAVAGAESPAKAARFQARTLI